MGTLDNVIDQIQTFWLPTFQSYLFERMPLLGLTTKQFEGQIKQQGDTVRVSMITPPTAEILTAGIDDEHFTSQRVVTQKVDVKADKIAIATYRFSQMSELQSLVNRENPEVKRALGDSIKRVVNAYLYSLVSPSLSAPDHSIASVSTLAKANLIAARVLAGEALWNPDEAWYGLLSPSYWGDVLTETTFTSNDYVDDKQLVYANDSMQRCGFNLFEDNSKSGDYGLFFTPDFLYTVKQTELEVKISDLHPTHQLGYLMSVSMVFGAKLGLDGAKKHIVIYNT